MCMFKVTLTDHQIAKKEVLCVCEWAERINSCYASSKFENKNLVYVKKRAEYIHRVGWPMHPTVYTHTHAWSQFFHHSFVRLWMLFSSSFSIFSPYCSVFYSFTLIEPKQRMNKKSQIERESKITNWMLRHDQASNKTSRYHLLSSAICLSSWVVLAKNEQTVKQKRRKSQSSDSTTYVQSSSSAKLKLHLMDLKRGATTHYIAQIATASAAAAYCNNQQFIESHIMIVRSAATLCACSAPFR